ncbi:hypothetical protein O1611_g2590 [Lasiodiplodia mahajangana]|uniref:Uncharacterized protein n=1 Tax=Lasiodiplodia mahajangana TaxID=1108764 RepID=A0ACC2JUU9_9PEZI|nr:hypothetical protein O1611_g2590 [Lasiodiplodia mahajangana]
MATTVEANPDFPMLGWTYAEQTDAKFSRTPRSRKTFEELKGNNDILPHGPGGRINIHLNKLSIANRRFEEKREQAR